MKVHEYQAKEILRRYGVATPKGHVTDSPEEARQITKELGGKAVVKGRIHAGDGYLTRWPDDATVLLERTSNGQPAMIAYRHGAGRVWALTLYPDWGYGAGQSSPAERALVRDLVRAALAWPETIPEHRPGDAVAPDVRVVNRSWAPTAAVSLEPRTPDRAALPATRADRPLAPGESASLPLELTAPDDPGIYPVGHSLFDDGGTPRQTGGDGAFFAV